MKLAEMMVEYCSTLTQNQSNRLLSMVKHCHDVLDLFAFYHICEHPYRNALEENLKKEGFGHLVDLFQQAESGLEASHSALLKCLNAASAAGEIPSEAEMLPVLHAFASDCLHLPCLSRYAESLQLYNPGITNEYLIKTSVKALFDAIYRLLAANGDEARLYTGYRIVFMRVFDIFETALSEHGISMGTLNHNRFFSIKSDDRPNLEKRLRTAFSDTGDVIKDILVLVLPRVSDATAANRIFEALTDDREF